jgi:uncharacterized flavoprotein (TIGR03862 family)
MPRAVIIGAGPAGLMAAEILARAGHQVVVAERKPSPARKFLMAGKSGLNLTKDEPLNDFLAQYGAAVDWLAPMLRTFGPTQVRDWSETLGQPVFTGSSKRVFPVSMKGSPLLRAWLAQLRGMGVEIQTRWHWVGWHGSALRFETPAGVQELTPSATVLALGGSSWARLGSDGAWAHTLSNAGIALAPFQPANMGFCIPWSLHMAPHFGAPVKPVCLRAGRQQVRGEFVISTKGLEGSAIYALSQSMRNGAALIADLMPQTSAAFLAARIAQRKPKQSLGSFLRKLGLSPVKIALLNEFYRHLPANPMALAETIKALPISHTGPRPLDEAISTAGGIPQSALNGDLMLHQIPGVFAAGEMLDWEALTGGYLLTACLATGRWAGHGAAQFLAKV